MGSVEMTALMVAISTDKEINKEGRVKDSESSTGIEYNWPDVD